MSSFATGFLIAAGVIVALIAGGLLVRMVRGA